LPRPSRSWPAGRTGDRLFVAAVVVVFTVPAALTTASGFNQLDEAWFLQVVARVADGETLYEDVFFGVPPLSVYLTLPLVALLGVQIAWVKAVVLGAFAASLALAVVTARRLGAGRWECVALAATMLVFTKPFGIGLYQPLASTFTLACLAATLAWAAQLETVPRDARRERLTLLLAGAAAGLAFSAKQNIGLYALGALLAAILVLGAVQRVRSAALALASCSACALLPLLPVVATGAFDDFVHYGFADLGTYNELGGISYVDAVRETADRARDFLAGSGATASLTAVLSAYQILLYLLVPATLAALAYAWTRIAGEERSRVVVVLLFTLAAAAGIFPRADPAHLAFAAPVPVLAAWYVLHLLARGLSRSRRRALALAVAVGLVPAVAIRAAWPAVQIADQDASLSAVPHTNGILITPTRERRMRATARALARAAEGRTLLLATADAGFYYLIADLQNPSPFDFPLATAMGTSGETELAAAVRAGEFDVVCLGFGRGDASLVPRELVQAIRETMRPGARTHACTLYERAT
jgi:4-amino-4-deoxy-L-arabinose transferase-like glycosyltransferase